MVGAWLGRGLTEFAALSRLADQLTQRESLGTRLEAIRYGGNGVCISEDITHIKTFGTQWLEKASQLPGNGHKDKCTGH